jgi:hypothetical protein
MGDGAGHLSASLVKNAHVAIGVFVIGILYQDKMKTGFVKQFSPAVPKTSRIGINGKAGLLSVCNSK